jgi:hypothetical protein
MVKVQFRLTFPVHKRGHYYITPVFPTNNLQVTFDYSDVADKIDVNCHNLLSSTEIFSRPPKSIDSRVIVKHNGWVIPKSSVFFHWFEHKKQVPCRIDSDNLVAEAIDINQINESTS